ncbi:thiamine pyrophosphate-binding protein [Pseudomonas sp. SDI]|uniref:thiamine pyrophosphate-binding protein n=1 Tax=Pseudomonas sp. SDI TaxID=2170734 RepID=UPI000DE6C8B2|nr:thiamine pyrophosphate-binding protein [Pseudomonas sp. SDI]PWB30936.1 thiamine pyrophosphate-binding protein [Pseudomonas sp. SDI]
MSKANAIAQRPLARLWHTWRFHINILLILIPLGFMPKYFHDASLFRGDSGLGEHQIGEIAVGPWTLQLAELRNDAPRADGPAGHFKVFNAALCKTCIGEVKAVYLRIGKPRSLRAAGVLFSGTPYRMSANLPIPPRTTPDAELWITLEGWDGSLQQTAIPLAKASPATLAWLNQQGGK